MVKFVLCRIKFQSHLDLRFFLGISESSLASSSAVESAGGGGGSIGGISVGGGIGGNLISPALDVSTTGASSDFLNYINIKVDS